MADKPAEKKEAPKKDEKGGEEKKGGGLMSKTPVLLSGVMLIQAGIVLAGVKFLIPSAPAPAGAAITEDADGAHPSEADHSADSHADAKDGSATERTYDEKKSYSLKLISMKAPNKTSGRTFLYDMEIWVMVKGKLAKRVESTIAEREALIQDRLRTIIAQSDPEKLGGGSEPGLETLRRQVKHQLDEIVGEGVIDEVLVPRCIPFRTDF